MRFYGKEGYFKKSSFDYNEFMMTRHGIIKNIFESL